MSDLSRNPERPAGAQSAPGLRRSAVLTALVAAVLAGAVSGGRIGLGVVVCMGLVGVTGRLGREGPMDGWGRAWFALAATLAATAMLRDADWVVVPALLAAVLLMSLALAGGRSWAGVVAGSGRVVARFGRGPLAVAAGARSLLPRGSLRLAPALRGIGLAAALLAIFGLLFASSDAAFERIAATALPELGAVESLPVRVFWAVVAIAIAGALASAGRVREAEQADRAKRLSPAEWSIALGALNLLFAVFVAVQASVLFGKDTHVLNTAGLTYAEYAREGFAQLVVAAALTLAVVAGALRWARAEGGGERILLRVLLAALCGLTLVVLASAAHRLDLYQDAFGATRLRLMASGAIAWLAILLALVLAATAAARYGFLPRACVLASALVMAGFVLADPDRRIAERNVDLFAREQVIDVEYLRGLSSDAVPALVELPSREREETLVRNRRHLAADDGWAGWNASLDRARKALREADAQ